MLVNLPESERQGLLKRTIELMNRKAVTFTSEHHNAVFQSQLENNAISSLPCIFNEISEQNITLDSTSYNLLIKTLCNAGDFESAMKVVNDIERTSLNADELIYTPIMSAYMSAGNIDGALEIKERMDKHGIVANKETYECFLLGYAVTGNIDGITQTLNAAIERDISVTPQTIIAVMKALVTCSQGNLIFETLDSLLEILQTDSYVKECANTVFQLRSENELVALQLIQTCSLFLSRGQGYDFTIQVLQHLKNTDRSFRLYQMEPLLKLLPMLNQKDSVKLWSCLLDICNMKEISEQLDAREIAKEEIIGIPEKRFMDYLSSGNFECAIDFAKNKLVKMTSVPNSLASAIKLGYFKSGKDSERTAWSLKQCTLIAGVPLVKVNSTVIFSILEHGCMSDEEIQSLIKCAWKQDIKISENSVRTAVQKTRSRDNKEFLAKWATDLIVHIPERAEMLTMSLQQLEELHAELHQMGVESERSLDLEEIMLQKYVEGHKEKADTFKQNLDCRYYKDAFSKLQSCGRHAVDANQDPEEALEYRNVLKKFFPDHDINGFHLSVAACQARNGLVDEAFATVRSMRDYPVRAPKMQRINNAFFYPIPINMSVVQTLIANFEDASELSNMVHLLWNKGVIDETQVLYHAIQKHRTHKRRYSMAVLNTMFKETRDPLSENLFTVQSGATNEGLLEAQLMFYCSLVEEGRLDLVRQCFENPNFRPVHRLQVEWCNWIFQNFENSERDQWLGLLLDINGVNISTLVTELSQAVPVQKLASSIFGRYHRFEESNSHKTKTNKKLQVQNETLITFVETSGKQLPFRRIKAHTEGLQWNQMWLEFVDFVCALRNKNLAKDIEIIAGVTTKPLWTAYALKQLIRLEIERGDYSEVEKIIKKIKSKPYWSKLPCVHIPSLLKLQEENKELAKVLESHILSLDETNAGFSLLTFYLKSGCVNDAKHLLQTNTRLRNRASPEVIIRSIEDHTTWTNEQLLVELLHLPVAEQHTSALKAAIYDQIINTVCDVGKWESGIRFYSEAVDSGVKLGLLKVSTLKKLQALLVENRQRIPWAVTLKPILHPKRKN